MYLFIAVIKILNISFPLFDFSDILDIFSIPKRLDSLELTPKEVLHQNFNFSSKLHQLKVSPEDLDKVNLFL